MKAVVFSFIPSPYQVELFDAIHDSGELALRVIYVARSEPGRPWSTPRIRHDHAFLSELGDRELISEMDGADLAVFSWYGEPRLRDAMRTRLESGRPWCLWSERPGFRRPGALGRWLRRFRLWSLWTSDAPIWGIGQWAIEGYRRELGGGHLFFDIPYFSNLSRFRAIRNPTPRVPKRVLYSGSLIHRKGIDTLANAWRQVSPRFPSATLRFLGSGAMGRELARILAPVDRTISLLGPVDWDQVPEVYGSADLLCAPSRYDGRGLVIPEAFASGLPVVASSAMGASREMLVEGRQGWFVEPGDVSSLASKLSAALSLSADEYASMSRLAVNTSLQFDVSQGSRRFVEAARKTVAHFGGGE